METTRRNRRSRRAQEFVPCAFCRGQGTDPFGIMSELSVCGSCQGTGRLLVDVPHVPCVYCGGSGSYKTYRCPVCTGSGVIPEEDGPTVVCEECRGRGADPSSGLVCLPCRGRGRVPDQTGAIE